MTPPMAGKLQELLSQGKWEPAFELLRELSPTAAADLIMSMRFEDQQLLFRQLPIPLAASIVNHLPYFHAYVLLHCRPLREMAEIVEAMNPAERDHFSGCAARGSLDFVDGRTLRGRLSERAVRRRNP